MPDADPHELEAEIDRLYAGPVADFVAARKALVGRLRSGGAREAARQAAALPRPSATAAAVNRLYWQHRELFSAVRRAGERVRRAHEGVADAGPLAEALSERREALAAAVRAALAELGGGQGAGSAAERRIRGTLEAVAAGVGLEPRDGRLHGDLDPPGFDALSGLAPALAPATPERPGLEGPPLGPAPDRRAQQNALALAEAELGGLRRRLKRAREAERAAAVRAEATQAEIAEAERRLERARRRREEVRLELERAREESAAAHQAATRAEETLESLRRRAGEAPG